MWAPVIDANDGVLPKTSSGNDPPGVQPGLVSLKSKLAKLVHPKNDLSEKATLIVISSLSKDVHFSKALTPKVNRGCNETEPNFKSAAAFECIVTDFS